MKNQTTMILVGGAAVIIGVYLYRKSKEDKAATAAVAPAQEMPAQLDQLKTPVASDVLPVNLPGTLLQPTSGNTGIAPPIVSSPYVAPVPALEPAKPQPVIAAQPTTAFRAPTTGTIKTVPAMSSFAPGSTGSRLKGLGNAYALS